MDSLPRRHAEEPDRSSRLRQQRPQGANAIAVRDPAVSWDSTKAIFSMVVGAPTQRYQVKTFFWQLYEVSGMARPRRR